MNDGQQLYDLEAEEAAIGSILIDPDVLKTTDLHQDDFHSSKNKWIFEAARNLEAKGEEIDYLTISTALTASGRFQEIGINYIAGIINKTPSSAHFQAYAGIVKDMATRRQLLRQANEMAKGAYDLQKPVDLTIGESMSRIPQLARVRSGAQHVSVFARRNYDRVEELQKNPVKYPGLITGIVPFDRAAGGVRLSELLLLLGKPGLGKTILMMQIAFGLGDNGYGGAVYQMETSEEQIMDREVSRRGEVLTERIETGSMTSEDWNSYTAAIDALSNPDLPVFMSFETSWTTTSLRADLTRLKAEHDIKWFVVDYMKFLNDHYGKDETERQNHISKQLKMICRELNIAGLVIHSMNKAGLGSDIPDLNNMSQGADIAFDCDKALFMIAHTPEFGNPDPNGRTFLYQKSRSKLNEDKFHMLKVRGFPAFVDFEQIQSKPVARQPKPNYVDYTERNG